MTGRVRRIVWLGGWPIRAILLAPIRVYRVTFGHVLGGGCRFYPSCSAYGEQAIAELGAIRGVWLSLWRLLRCSPLTAGGVEYPPRRRPLAPPYDADIRAPAPRWHAFPGRRQEAAP